MNLKLLTQEFKVNKTMLFLIIFFLIGLSLRLYRLGSQNLWLDEYATFSLLSKFNLFELLGASKHLNDGPLYYILLKIWLMFFHNNEFGLRSLSMLFGILLIPLIYKSGKLFFNEKVGLISAFILAISPMHIWYSQEARGYSLGTFLSVLAVYYFIAALKNNKLYLWIGFIASSVSAAYTHYFCFYIILVAAIIFIASRYKRLKYLTLSLFIICAISLFRLSVFLNWLNLVKESFWVLKPDLNSIIITFENFNLGFNAPAWGYFIVFVIFSFLFLLGIQCWRLTKEFELVTLLLFLFIPIISTFLISKIIPIYIDRYLMPFSPFYYLVIASGFFKIKSYFIKSAIFSITLAITLICLSNYYLNKIPLGLFHHQGALKKVTVRPAADYIRDRFEEGDAIGYSEPETLPIFYYMQDLISKQIDMFVFINKLKLSEYSNSIGERAGYNHYFPGLPKFTVVGLYAEKSYRNFQKYKFKRLWFIARPAPLGSHAVAVRRWMRRHYSILETKEFEGIFIDLYIPRE